MLSFMYNRRGYVYVHIYIDLFVQKKRQKDKPQINEVDCLQSRKRAEKHGERETG